MIVTLHPSFKPHPIVLPIATLILAMFCFQIGAALAKQLFPAVGAAGTAALRLGLASPMMIAVWRAWRPRPSLRRMRIIVLYGLSMGLMNCFFYLSLNRIPLGIAVALEFTGPLAVAMAASRRPIDFLWIVLAAMGLIALLPLGQESTPLAPAGIGFGLAAAVCWASYIVFGQMAGKAHSGQTAALGTTVGAIALAPVGLGHAGWLMASLAVLPVACMVALLSSAVPYSLEMYAMNRVPARTFGVLMSLDPALAALSGICFLGETLAPMQWAAIASIMVASAGSAATARARPRRPPDS